MGTLSDFIGGAGGGGATGSFKASENILANSFVSLQKNGTITPLTSTVTPAGAGSLQSHGFGAATVAGSFSGSHYNYTTDNLVSAYNNGSANYVVAASNSGGTLTWGSRISLGNSTLGGCKVTYDAEHGYYVVWYNVPAGHLYFRVFTLSGNTLTQVGGEYLCYYYFFTNFDAIYLPDEGIHVFMGTDPGEKPRAGRIYLDSSGVPSGDINNSNIAQAPDSAVFSTRADTFICDMGGGNVGGFTAGNNTTDKWSAYHITAKKGGVSISAVGYRFNLSGTIIGTNNYYSGTGGIAADKKNKKIALIASSGSGIAVACIFSYAEFIAGFPTTVTEASLGPNRGHPRATVSLPSGGLYTLYWNYNTSKASLYSYSIADGYVSGGVAVDSQGSTEVLEGSTSISPNPFTKELWVVGAQTITGKPLGAINFNIGGALTNSGAVLGTAVADIPSGNLGEVSLLTRDLGVTDIRSDQIFIQGKEYFEDSLGTGLATSGSNRVGYAIDTETLRVTGVV